MTTTSIKEFLQNQLLATVMAKLDSQFHVAEQHRKPQHQAQYENVTRTNYLPPLAALFEQLKPRRILSIGALYGTLETYVLQCTKHNLEEITICDLDTEQYGSNRENGAFCYLNICGTKYGAFQGLFTFIRGDSKADLTRSRIAACGPYDLIFVDGEHTREAICIDLNTAAQNLAPNGTILAHDVDLKESGTNQGWIDWKLANPDWQCEEVNAPDFFCGLGFARRVTENA